MVVSSTRESIPPDSARKLFSSQKLERVYFQNNLPKVTTEVERLATEKDILTASLFRAF